MTLKEKFKKIDIKLSETHSTLITNREADIMETIADDFAIAFTEWLVNTYYSYNFGIKMFQHRNKEIYKTTNELLEIYKKEKGL